jgi:hypothetical protein
MLLYKSSKTTVSLSSLLLLLLLLLLPHHLPSMLYAAAGKLPRSTPDTGIK